MDARYPTMKVDLSTADGNAFAILGKVMSALRQGDVPDEEVALFMEEAKSGDYDHLLQTCMSWVNVT